MAGVELDIDELLTTTRSVRKRLDFDRPVEREVVEECLSLAVQAPSGMNNQRWHWVFVSDPAKKERLAGIYQQSFTAVYGPDVVSESTGADRRILDSARYLADNFARVPVMMIPCQWRRVDGAAVREQAGFWGSLLPAVWSFQLALRSRGLGSTWTTLHLDQEREAAEILGIPYELCTQAGLFPIAYTVGTEFKPAARQPLDTVTHWNGW